MPAIKKLMDEVLSGPSMAEELAGALAEERKIVGNAKKLALFVAGVASQRYMMKLADEQEVMAAMANIIIETYAMESALLRAEKLIAGNGESASQLASAMARVYVSAAMDKIESNARKVIAAAAEGDNLRIQTAVLRRLVKYDPINSVALRQQIAQKIIEAGKYVSA
jgi:butyryl-CoA dehydrogenase